MARTIAWDFDGVIHPYTKGWTGPVPDDEPPMDGVIDLLESYRQAGHAQVIYSTRCDTGQGLAAVWAWLKKWEIDQYFADVTCQKPMAVAYIDDRAVTYDGDWDAVREGVERLVAGRKGEPRIMAPGWRARDCADSYYLKYIAEQRAEQGLPVNDSTGDLIMRHPDDCEECKANPAVHDMVKRATDGVIPAIVDALRPFFEDDVPETLLVNMGMSAFMAGGDAMQRVFG